MSVVVTASLSVRVRENHHSAVYFIKFGVASLDVVGAARRHQSLAVRPLHLCRLAVMHLHFLWLHWVRFVAVLWRFNLVLRVRRLALREGPLQTVADGTPAVAAHNACLAQDALNQFVLVLLLVSR